MTRTIVSGVKGAASRSRREAGCANRSVPYFQRANAAFLSTPSSRSVTSRSTASATAFHSGDEGSSRTGRSTVIDPEVASPSFGYGCTASGGAGSAGWYEVRNPRPSWHCATTASGLRTWISLLAPWSGHAVHAVISRSRGHHPLGTSDSCRGISNSLPATGQGFSQRPPRSSNPPRRAS